MLGLPLLALQALLGTAVGQVDGEACARDGPAGSQACAATGLLAEEALGSLAAAFGCAADSQTGSGDSNQTDALPGSAVSSSHTALECIFSAVYPARAGHATSHKAREMTYGELGAEGFAGLFGGYGLVGVPAEGRDAFVDLGSGTGKLPIQALLHGVHDSRGVELDEDRHSLGAAALEQLHAKLEGSRHEASPSSARLSLQPGGASVLLSQGDLLKCGLAAGTSIVFAASLCFPDGLIAGVAAKLREELPPGAIVWSLKELPAGGHEGLALVGKLPVKSTWSLQTRFFVYVRTPPVRPVADLPPQAAAASLAEDAGAAFARLAAALGAEDGGEQGLSGDRYLPTEAAVALGARTVPAALRLLRALGARQPRGRGDLCGCRSAPGAPLGWSLMPADLVGMLGHGAFLHNSTGAPCLTLSQACTLGDLVAGEHFESIRKEVRCKQDARRASCDGSGRDGGTASLARVNGWPCARSSDGRTLLQAALFRDRTELGEAVLEATGNASVDCTDQEGQTAAHVAMRHSSGATLAWLLPRLAAGGGGALRAADGWGRTPAALARDAAALRALHAVGGLEGGAMDARDGAGRSPLAHAVQRGDEELAGALLELRADPSSTGDLDSSPLMLAARRRKDMGVQLVRALVTHRADVHARHGSTLTAAMHVAASHGGPETVRALLELRADPDVEALHGLRPVDLATDPEVLAVLRGPG